MIINRPALVVYAFAPKRLPSNPALCAAAVRHLSRLWESCTLAGMTDPVTRLGLKAEFPSGLDGEGTGFRLLAAKHDPQRLALDAHYQAFVYEYQDVYGLVATLESHEEGTTLAGWQELDAVWRQVAPEGDPPEGLLGEALLFHALCDDRPLSLAGQKHPRARLAALIAEQAGAPVLSALPGNNHPGLAPGFYLTDEGYCLWEAEAAERRRVIALLAPSARQEALGAWSVWAGSGQLAPFARYLMHGFKLRFAQGLFKGESGNLARQREQVDGALEELSGLLDREGGEESFPLEKFETAQRRLSRAQARGYGLVYSHTRLKELGLMVQVAERNLRALVPAHHPDLDPAEGSIFPQDAARADWLRRQLETELGYLEAVHRRADEGHRIVGSLLEFESRRNEGELRRLVLLQGTLIGSLLAGLTAIQAFAPPLPQNDSEMVAALKWSLVAVLMAAALALPPLFAHWRERYKRFDLIAAGLLGAALVWFVTALWGWALPRLSLGVGFGLWLVYELAAAAVGFVVGYRGAVLLERLKAKRPHARGAETADGEQG